MQLLLITSLKAFLIYIVRFFNTVGPRQASEYGMVLPRFIQQALIQIINTDACIGEIINVGGEEEVTIYELAEKVKAATHSSSPIKLIPYDKAFNKDFEDIQYRKPCIDKIKKLIQWSPQYNLDSIIEKTVVFERQKIEDQS